jgi:hypothetical protein
MASMHARDQLAGHMSALPDGPFTNKQTCEPYAEEELLAVSLAMQGNVQEAGPADTSES